MDCLSDLGPFSGMVHSLLLVNFWCGNFLSSYRAESKWIVLVPFISDVRLGSSACGKSQRWNRLGLVWYLLVGGGARARIVGFHNRVSRRQDHRMK